MYAVIEKDYDVVIGPVANDNTMPVITLYLRGDYDVNETIKRLLTREANRSDSFQNRKKFVVFKVCRGSRSLKINISLYISPIFLRYVILVCS